jgi:hypothetical protein
LIESPATRRRGMVSRASAAAGNLGDNPSAVAEGFRLKDQSSDRGVCDR